MPELLGTHCEDFLRELRTKSCALHVILVHAYDVIHPERLKKVDNDLRILDFFSKYLKIILLGFVPFVALSARLIFRRLKLNLAEHFILSGINLLGMLVIALFYMFLQFVNEYQMPVWVVWFQLIAFFLILIYPAWTYYGATKKTYRFLGFLWRITVFYLLILLQLSLILYWIYFEITNNSDITFRL